MSRRSPERKYRRGRDQREAARDAAEEAGFQERAAGLLGIADEPPAPIVDPDVLEARRRRAEADTQFEQQLAKARTKLIVHELERRDTAAGLLGIDLEDAPVCSNCGGQRQVCRRCGRNKWACDRTAVCNANLRHELVDCPECKNEQRYRGRTDGA
jgi:hypothetical protein